MTLIEAEQTLGEADFAALQAIIHRETGITIPANRKRMLSSRLQRRLIQTGSGTYAAYIKHLAATPAELQELTDRVTTNETYFYRTPRIWSHLREHVIPAFIAKAAGRPMKLWSAAASTGEEAHTLGVVLEQARRRQPALDYSILGTDISSRVIALAREGRYVGRSLARFRREAPALFDSHLQGNDADGFRATADIRRRITFRRHNLLQPLTSGGPFDVVLLRNALIYFADPDQEKILANVHQQLRPGGTLIIGESETLKHLRCDFAPVAPLIYQAAPSGQGTA